MKWKVDIMTERNKANRVKQDGIVKNIEVAIALLNQIDQSFEAIGNEQQINDQLISDYNHLIEEYELQDKARLQITYKLSTLYDQRRELKNISMLKNTWNKNTDKLRYLASRGTIMGEIKKTLDHLDKPYRSRVMSEEDKKLLLDCDENEEKPTKNTRGRKPIENCEEILTLLAKGNKVKDIATELGVPISRVYSVRSKAKCQDSQN
jgi:hypothetical protein